MKRILSSAVVLLVVAPALAKPEHYEKLRVLLMTEKARCTSCHTDVTAEQLNAYGKALSELGQTVPLAERMRLLDHEPSESAKADEKKRFEKYGDVDHDGVPNWIEIVAGTDPADKSSKPDARTRERIERVVSCTICHTGTNLPGRTERESNPHNELGKLLAKTIEPKERASVGRDPKAIADAAEQTPILRRWKLAAMKPGGSKGSYWEKLLLLCAPADAKDVPDKKALAELRKAENKKKSAKPHEKDPVHGMGPHKPSGFLLDVK